MSNQDNDSYDQIIEQYIQEILLMDHKYIEITKAYLDELNAYVQVIFFYIEKLDELEQLEEKINRLTVTNEKLLLIDDDTIIEI